MTKLVTCAVLLPALAWAQAVVAPPPLPPPPLMNAPDAPTAAPGDQAPTPPPPGSNPPTGSNLTPSATGYQPYFGNGYTPKALKPEGPEVGLMVTESAFGILTAAASTLLPFLLLSQLNGVDQNLGTILLLVVLAAEPLSVAQTELGIANGSHFYMNDSWPSMLAGLGTEGAVIGLFYLLSRSLSFTDGGVAFLLGSSVIAVPLVEMAVINLTKYPRNKMYGAVHYSKEDGWAMSVPIPAPYVTMNAQGTQLGVSLPLLAGRF